MPYIYKIIGFCLVTTFLGIAQVQPVVSEEDGEGNVDWGKRAIVARGIGAPSPDVPEAARRPGAIRAA